MHLRDDKLDLSYVHVLKIVPAKMEYSYKQHIRFEFAYFYKSAEKYRFLSTYLEDLFQTIFLTLLN